MSEYVAIFESFIIPEDALESAIGDKVAALITRVQEFFKRLIQRIKDWIAKITKSDRKIHTAARGKADIACVTIGNKLQKLCMNLITADEFNDDADKLLEKGTAEVKAMIALHHADSDYVLCSEGKTSADELIRTLGETANKAIAILKTKEGNDLRIGEITAAANKYASAVLTLTSLCLLRNRSSSSNAEIGFKNAKIVN